ncbi:MAG: hypothetical protein ACFE8A_13390 [Candidatus Hodarchaeota archaeon]
MGIRCPFCDGKEIEDITYEIAGNKYFDPKTQKFYHCKGKRMAKKYNELIDCETEFLISKIEKKAKRNDGEVEEMINRRGEIQNAF